MMLCPFNRGKIAPPKDLAVQVACTCGCLMLHKMLHRGFLFLLVTVVPQPTSTCLYWGRPGKMLPRAQHPRRMEHTGDFALKRGCVGKGDLFPSPSWMPAGPERVLHGDSLLQKGEHCT